MLGGERFDLDGQPSGVITDAERRCAEGSHAVAPRAPKRYLLPRAAGTARRCPKLCLNLKKIWGRTPHYDLLQPLRSLAPGWRLGPDHHGRRA